MDDKKKNLLSLVLSLCSVYGDYSVDINDIYVDDKEVMDCQFKLYMVMLASDPELSDKLFLEFEELYNKLSKEKQEYIKEDLRKILENQDKHNKEKEKRL